MSRGCHAIIRTPEELAEVEKEAEAEKRLLSQNDKALLKAIRNLPSRMQKVAIKALAHMGRKTFTEICREAGYKTGPHNKVSSIKNCIKGVLGPALREAGLTEYDIVSKYAELLYATKQQIVVINGKAEIFKVPDNAIRLATLKALTKLGDYNPAKKLSIKGNVEHSLGAGPESVALLKQREKQIEQSIKADFNVVEDDRDV